MSPNVVLVMGAIGLDRLMTVASFPTPDDKIRTLNYHEMGGGNAANTATAMAKLSSSQCFQKKNFTVQLLGKIGDDHVGLKLVEEFKLAGVDLSSPLFMVGDKDTTTGVTAVIVSQQDSSRTCIHTPGTCGELSLSDVQSVSLDEVFENVVHLHLDARHPQVALVLAEEARERGITVSLDIEKDRESEAVDQLLEHTTHIFTNAQQIEQYLNKLHKEMELVYGRYPLRDPTVTGKAGTDTTDMDWEFYARSIKPSYFFTRWYQEEGKFVITSKGDMGALSVKCDGIVTDVALDDEATVNEIQITMDKTQDKVRAKHSFLERSKTTAGNALLTTEYSIYRSGALQNVNVVDTTGAGDAFIGGYLLGALTVPNDVPFCLSFGCWVGGRKCEGPGARNAQPKAKDVDEMLGTTIPAIKESLQRLLQPFGHIASNVKAHESNAWEAMERT